MPVAELKPEDWYGVQESQRYQDFDDDTKRRARDQFYTEVSVSSLVLLHS